MSLTDFLQFAASSGVGGVVVALANHFLTKRKTSAEIDKLNADTELTKAQARQITNSFDDLSDKVGYKLPEVAHSTETIIYTSTDSDRFDFRLLNVDNAEGELTVRSGVLSISRGNTVRNIADLARENTSMASQPRSENFYLKTRIFPEPESCACRVK
jgi:hypothetical protein